MKIDRQKFFDQYRAAFGSLVQPQVDGLEFLLVSIEADAPFWTGVQTLSISTDQVAYMLATVKHETENRFEPADELGAVQYFENRYGPQTSVGRALGNTDRGDGAKYHGRGYVQLTGKNNYVRAMRDLASNYPETVRAFEGDTAQGFNLVARPEQAKDPAIAYAIMSYGMRMGRFTGARLSTFFNSQRQDPLNARRIINGLDRAQLIAGYWSGIVTALRAGVSL